MGSRNQVNSLTTTRLPHGIELPQEKGDTPLVEYIDFITETIEYHTESAVSGKLVSITDNLEKANTISFSSESYSSDLYFGVDVHEEERLSYSLPPTFAQMAFDARFSGDTKLVPESGLIELITHSETVTIEYNIKIDAGDSMRWVLRSGNGEDYTLEGSGELTVPSRESYVLA